MSAAQPPLLPPLDAAPGPSALRSTGELAAMRAAIVARASGRAGATAGARWVWPVRLAAGFALSFAMAGTGLAAVRAWPAVQALFTGGGAEATTAVPAAPAVSGRGSRVETAVQAPPDANDRMAGPSPSAVQAPPDANDRMAGPSPSRRERDWLARANQLRGQQRWRAAEALYLHGLEAGTSGAARSAAALAAAELRLNQLRQPRGALVLFERALSLEPGGALAAQARHGIAQSYRALGDRAREAEALHAFLRADPDSTMRPRAEQRLRELER